MIMAELESDSERAWNGLQKLYWADVVNSGGSDESRLEPMKSVASRGLSWLVISSSLSRNSSQLEVGSVRQAVDISTEPMMSEVSR